MASNVVQMVLKIKDGATPALESVSDAADDATASAGGAAKQFKITGESMAKFGAAALAAGVAVGSLIKSVVDARNELIDTSTRTGLTAETIAGLKLAAEGSGLQLANLATGLQQLPKRMADVARGTGEAKVAFEQLGISVVNADGSLRSADDVLRESLNALQNVESATERSALATQLFGEAGTGLLQALSGSQLEEFVNQAERFGVKVGPDAAKAAGDFQRELANMQMMADGAKETFISAFGDGPNAAGTVMKAFGALTVGVATTIKVNFDTMRQIFGSFTGHIGDIIGEIINISQIFDLIANKKFKQAADIAEGSAKRMADATMRAKVEFGEGMFDMFTGASIREGFKAGIEAFSAVTAGTGGQPQSGGITQLQRATAGADTDDTAKQSAKKADDQLKQLQKMRSTLQGVEKGIDRQLNELEQLPHDVAMAMLDSVTGPLLKPTETLRNSLSKSLGPGGTLIGAFADIGAQNPKQIAKEFAGFFKNIVRAFTTVLPELIVMIPQVLIESLPQVLGGLLKALPKLIGSVVFKLPAMLIKVFGRWLVKSIGGFFDVFINELPSKFVKGLRRWFKGALRKIRDIFKPGKIFKPETQAGR
ncbi:phage tail tape measure protein, partial [Acinetobacter sp.]|uniref:phage tail tape measure protein n=1 Tax=Acinetobacter sp. TaxID=472 RepID=UPI000C09653C